MPTKQDYVQALKYFGEAFGKVYNRDAEWMQKFNAGDDSGLEALSREACQKAGIDPVNFENAVETDPELRSVRKFLINEVVLRDQTRPP